MDGVLNETTMTVHKRKPGGADVDTVCGLTFQVNPEQLRTAAVDQATSAYDASKCGRCFEDAGGY